MSHLAHALGVYPRRLGSFLIVSVLMIGIFGQAIGTPPTVSAQGVEAVVVNEFANIRLIPAIGAEVLGTESAGYVFNIITARSGDHEWVRVIYNGQEGWVNLAPLVVLQGDVNALPVADPRTIPYGGFEAPRAGSSDQMGNVAARATDGLRVRSGPSRAYPTLTNINFNQGFTITGRTGANTWYQVNFEGTLGWVSAFFVEILSGDVFATPIDGIVASSPPLIGRDTDDFLGILRLMRARLDISQASLDTIRRYWTDAALAGRAFCQAYPARPSDFPIATPLLAANYVTLTPLQADFNTAMANLRLSIDLFIQICNLPGRGNPVGQATVQGALNTVNLTESQFNDLRARLDALIPVDDGVGRCVLRYNARTELLPIISQTTIYIDSLDGRKYTIGYCFDGLQGQVLRLEALPIPPSNLGIFLAISAIDTPDSFLAVGRTGGGASLTVGPVTLPRTARYVILIADLDNRSATQGRFALRISDITFDTNVGVLTYDPNTASVQVSVADTTSFFDEQVGEIIESVSGACPFTGDTLATISCTSLFTCEEAVACFAEGAIQLDATAGGDGVPGDGIPCNPMLCTSAP